MGEGGKQHVTDNDKLDGRLVEGLLLNAGGEIEPGVTITEWALNGMMEKWRPAAMVPPTTPSNKVGNMTDEQKQAQAAKASVAPAVETTAGKAFPRHLCHGCKKEIHICDAEVYFVGKSYHATCALKTEPVAPRQTVPPEGRIVAKLDLPDKWKTNPIFSYGGIVGQCEKWSAVPRTESHNLELGDDVEVHLFEHLMPAPTLRIAWKAASGQDVVFLITGKLGKLKEVLERIVGEVREKL